MRVRAYEGAYVVGQLHVQRRRLQQRQRGEMRERTSFDVGVSFCFWIDETRFAAPFKWVGVR